MLEQKRALEVVTGCLQNVSTKANEKLEFNIINYVFLRTLVQKCMSACAYFALSSISAVLLLFKTTLYIQRLK